MLKHLAAALLFVTLTAAAATPHDEVLSLAVSEGKVLSLGSNATTVFVADPTIADVQAPNGDHIVVMAKKPGRTSLYALDAAGRTLLATKIIVNTDTTTAHTDLARDPGAGSVQVVGSDTEIGLRGTANSPDSAANALALASSLTKDKIDDQSRVRGSAQVSLRVRIAEVTRTVTKQIGINWNTSIKAGSFAFGVAAGRKFLYSGTGTGLSNLFANPPTGALALAGATKELDLNALIDALADEGMVKILAEPTLTAISGQPASFLAGGEFPIPVSQNGNGNLNSITITFKQYGVSLSFVPTVMAPNHVSIHVRPEVSELTTQGQVQLNGITIPALTVRRADTTVELGSGQSFVIAGLLQNRTKTDLSRLPGLGDLPILGPLFRSQQFERDETELVIFVTPYIVRPIDDPTQVRLPTEGVRPPTDFEMMFLGRAVLPGDEEARDRPRLTGDVGFDLR